MPHAVPHLTLPTKPCPFLAGPNITLHPNIPTPLCHIQLFASPPSVFALRPASATSTSARSLDRQDCDVTRLTKREDHTHRVSYRMDRHPRGR